MEGEVLGNAVHIICDSDIVGGSCLGIQNTHSAVAGAVYPTTVFTPYHDCDPISVFFVEVVVSVMIRREGKTDGFHGFQRDLLGIANRDRFTLCTDGDGALDLQVAQSDGDGGSTLTNQLNFPVGGVFAHQNGNSFVVDAPSQAGQIGVDRFTEHVQVSRIAR